jgi:hypothetical protein
LASGLTRFNAALKKSGVIQIESDGDGRKERSAFGAAAQSLAARTHRPQCDALKILDALWITPEKLGAMSSIRCAPRQAGALRAVQ